MIFELFGFGKKEYFNDPSKTFISHVHADDRERVMHLNLTMIEYVNGLTHVQKKKIESRYYYQTIKNKWLLQTNRVVEYFGGLYDIGVIQVCSEWSDFKPPLFMVLNIGQIRKCILPPTSKLGHVDLSRREEEVLFWSLRAFGIESIAEQLNITNAGVRHHRRNILRKFNAKSFLEIKNLCEDTKSIP